MLKAAFLDRDGVINANVRVGNTFGPPRVISEIDILPGVIAALNLLSQNDYLVVIVTNQPDVARGTKKISNVNLINQHIGRETGISHFYVCPHDDFDKCFCRKPKPGLIEIASKELGIDLGASFLVGDRWRDIEAGQAMGLPSFFIDVFNSELSPPLPFTRVTSLLEAVTIRIGEENAPRH